MATGENVEIQDLSVLSRDQLLNLSQKVLYINCVKRELYFYRKDGGKMVKPKKVVMVDALLKYFKQESEKNSQEPDLDATLYQTALDIDFDENGEDEDDWEDDEDTDMQSGSKSNDQFASNNNQRNTVGFVTRNVLGTKKPSAAPTGILKNSQNHRNLPNQQMANSQQPQLHNQQMTHPQQPQFSGFENLQYQYPTGFHNQYGTPFQYHHQNVPQPMFANNNFLQQMLENQAKMQEQNRIFQEQMLNSYRSQSQTFSTPRNKVQMSNNVTNSAFSSDTSTGIEEDLSQVSVSNKRNDLYTIHKWLKFANDFGHFLDGEKNINKVSDLILIKCIAGWSCLQGKSSSEQRHCDALSYAVSQIETMDKPVMSNISDSFLMHMVKYIDLNVHNTGSLPDSTDLRLKAISLRSTQNNQATATSTQSNSYGNSGKYVRTDYKSIQELKEKTPIGFCINYQKKESCDKKDCTYAHYCRKCYVAGRGLRTHSAYKCSGK